MPAVTSLMRASSAARRSGVSNEWPSVSRAHNMAASGRAARDHLRHRLAAGGAHQIVGVLALRQQREFQALAGLEPRHRQFDRAIGRAQAGVVAVETQHRLVRHLPEQRELVFGQRRAERRDGGRQSPPSPWR